MTKKKTHKFNRSNELKRVANALNNHSYPKLEMFLLVLFTGSAGFLASYLLLNIGIHTIWLRYLISIGFAYVVFIGMLWLWMKWKTRVRNSSHSNASDDIVTIVDIPYIPNISSGTSSNANISGGGQFSGGGASTDFGSSSGESSGAIGEALGSVAEAEEGAIPLIVIFALLATLFSVFLIVFSLVASAPILFAELLVDGMLSASLYRRLKGVDKHHWLESAIKRTIWPFIFVAIIFTIAGWTMAHFMPNVISLGQVISILLAKV